MRQLAVVVPCFNEEAILSETRSILENVLEQFMREGLISPESYILFVDDGSRDATWDIISQVRTHALTLRSRGIRLTRNFGHQAALMAGMEAVIGTCDCCVTIDADLQDDVEIISEMLQLHARGKDVVYGVRKNRDTDSLFKRWTARFFYYLIATLGIEIVHDHADFRLVSDRALRALGEYKESNLFLRGIFPRLGLENACVYYNRKSRMAGETKYPFKKMVLFAIDGITAFSVVPLRLLTVVGFLISMISFSMGAYVIVAYVFFNTVHGWSSTVLPMYMLGGIQIFSMGVLGEYLGRIYLETKHRPRYSIWARSGFDGDS